MSREEVKDRAGEEEEPRPGLPSVAAGKSGMFLVRAPWEAWRRPREESFGTYCFFQAKH